MKLLDVGCGWGATMMRAMEKYDVDVVGLTLSKNQQTHIEQLFATSDSPRSKRVLLQSWEQFHEPVDRIVSIQAFEHFGLERYDDFFKMAYAALPAGGTMLLQTSLLPSKQEWAERNLPVTMSLLRFIGFMMREIFPGGRLPAVPLSRSMRSGVVSRSTWCSRCGLTTHEHSTSGRQLVDQLAEAIAVQSEEVYERYMKYLTGCADLFRDGYTDVCKFTLAKR